MSRDQQELQARLERIAVKRRSRRDIIKLGVVLGLSLGAITSITPAQAQASGS